MNCKQGDLAVIVRSAAGNEGKIVECVRLEMKFMEITQDGHGFVVPQWETNTPLRGCFGRVDRFVADSQLRPLRDNDGEDEVLRLVGRPVDTPQAAQRLSSPA